MSKENDKVNLPEYVLIIHQLKQERRDLGVKLMNLNVEYREYGKVKQAVVDQIKMVEDRIDHLLSKAYPKT